jgi:hypothetical protein
MKKKTGVAKQAEQNRKDAHILDERVKSLHSSIHKTHQDAKQFHAEASAAKCNTEIIEAVNRPSNGITEKDLQRSAEEQAAQVTLLGSESVYSKNETAKKKSALFGLLNQFPNGTIALMVVPFFPPAISNLPPSCDNRSFIPRIPTPIVGLAWAE